MNSRIITALGLSEKAGQVYLATLALGTAVVQDIAGHARLKRPTAYLYIEELLNDGLLEKVPVGKKIYYRAVDPKVLLERAQQNVQAIQDALPELQLVRSKAIGRPGVRVLEGEKAMRQVHREIAKANSIRFWSDLPTFEEKFPAAVDVLSAAIRKNQIRTREIIAATPAARRSAKRYAAVAGKYYTCRVASGGSLYNNSVVYGDVVALFRVHEFNLFVIIIEEATIAATMKTLFDLAWESAEPFIPARSQARK
jgi:sugar-specific transcriptional regulator TrmB